MRILVVTDQWFPDLKGGVARVAAETARRLGERGHEVLVIAPKAKGLPTVTREGPIVVRRTLPRTRLPKTLTDVAAAFGEGRRIGRQGFDVVVAHCSTVAVGLLAARVPAPMAYVYHASAPRELRDLRRRLASPTARLKTYPLAAPLALYEHLALQRADRVLVLSNFSASLVDEDHPSVMPRVRRVSGAVDVDAFAPDGGQEAARARLGIEPRRPLVVSVRRLEPRMGLDRLLHAVRLLEQRRPVELAVIGSGSLDSQLRRLAAELGLEGRVRFLGRVGDAELRDWYRSSDLFVLPTVSYEGFGMVTAEALASGTPVVGTPVGATPELLKPLEPLLVSAGVESHHLADAIDSALAISGAELRRRCREYAVSRFSWDAVLTEWEAALAEAAGRATR